MQILLWFLALPVFMLANRFCGGGWPRLSDPLPGRALYWVSPVLGLIAGLFWGWQLGVIVGVGFWLWRMTGWGLWFDLHRDDEEQKNDKRHDDLFVKAINAISFGSDYVALFWRHALFFLPVPLAWFFLAGNPFVAPLYAVAFGVLAVGAYELRWHTSLGNTLSEMLVGGLWWLFIAFLLIS
ncbi:hypothetical protein [Roseibium aggregatum]|uniref:Uncharacterized protein n=1 Tax=Roseibium aggregatum TaxID=187304 RepID=A0A0M6YAE1_9HYPH|nr:hypothetical protein [Roseibium aggregatum]CTQ45780.1 hypothetical protein LAL4801_04235 [Roseibium aggregatum]